MSKWRMHCQAAEQKKESLEVLAYKKLKTFVDIYTHCLPTLKYSGNYFLITSVVMVRMKMKMFLW